MKKYFLLIYVIISMTLLSRAFDKIETVEKKLFGFTLEESGNYNKRLEIIEKKLFGEFKKLNVSPTGGETSTGLGLAISKKIIEAHKGKIYGKNSDKTSGAVFGFCLPYEVN